MEQKKRTDRNLHKQHIKKLEKKFGRELKKEHLEKKKQEKKKAEKRRGEL